MGSQSNMINRWRGYFRQADGDIFDVLEYAILVAASDCPKEFRIRRDSIAQKLFSCRLIKCVDCDSIALAQPVEDRGNDSAAVFPVGKDSKVNSSCDENNNERVHHHGVSNYSYDEAEALTEEIEEQMRIIRQVERIKEILGNQDESDSSLHESLRTLQSMEFSVDTLKATEVGRAVSKLKKHGSKDIRNLAKILISSWKDMVDEWVRTTSAITMTDGSPDSVKPSHAEDEEEEGLPSPPLDEGVFLTDQPTSLEFSEFFDGIDDDGNASNMIDVVKPKEIRRRPQSEDHFQRRKNPIGEERMFVREQETILPNRQTKSSAVASVSDTGPGRPLKAMTESKLVPKAKPQQRLDSRQQTKVSISSQDKLASSNDVDVKLEAAKRKLHEGYQLAENAKKQRTIQVMELQDIPKQGSNQRHLPGRPGFPNRHWNNKTR